MDAGPTRAPRAACTGPAGRRTSPSRSGSILPRRPDGRRSPPHPAPPRHPRPDPAPPVRRTGRRRSLRGTLGPDHRPCHHERPDRGSGRGGVGRPRLLRGLRHRRRVEDHERGGHLRSRLPGPGHPFGGRRGGPPTGHQRGVGGDGRAGQPPVLVLGRRRLQVHRRRRELAEHGPPGLPAHRPDHPASRRCRRGVRGRHGPPVGSERGAGAVPLHRRGGELGARPGRRRGHGRGGRGDGPVGPLDPLRRHLPASAPPLGVPRRWPRKRPLEEHRRGRHLAEAHERRPRERSPPGRDRPHRDRHLPERPPHRLRERGAGGALQRLHRLRAAPCRHLPLRGPGGELGAHVGLESPAHVRLPDHGRSQRRPAHLHGEHVLLVR